MIHRSENLCPEFCPEEQISPDRIKFPDKPDKFPNKPNIFCVMSGELFSPCSIFQKLFSIACYTLVLAD